MEEGHIPNGARHGRSPAGAGLGRGGGTSRGKTKGLGDRGQCQLVVLLSLIGKAEEEEESSTSDNGQRLGAVCLELQVVVVFPLHFRELVDTVEARMSVLPGDPRLFLHVRCSLGNDEELQGDTEEDIAGSESHEAEVTAAVEVARSADKLFELSV